MKCAFCKHGETKPGTTTVTLEKNETTVVFKDVPADVCTTCGEPYVDEYTSERLLSIAKKAAEAGVEVDIRRYVAA